MHFDILLATGNMNLSSSVLLLFLKLFGVTFACICMCLFPALPFVQRLSSFDPLEKLCLALSSNFVLMYIAQWGAYLFSWAQWLPAALLLLMTAAGAAFTVAESSKRGTKGNCEVSWEGILIWMALTVWILGLQSGIVVYGAVSWGGDWFEHYERVLFFLDRLPPNTRFLHGLWSIAARGPLYNTSCALLMSLLGREFFSFQIISTVLNTTPVIIIALLFRRLAGVTQRQALSLGFLLLALSPFAVQQETYTWTKFFTLSYILGAIYFCLPAANDPRGRRVAWSILLSSAGTLAHFMAIPFLIFIGSYLFYHAARRRWKWKTFLYPTIVSASILSFWFGYCFVSFGFKGTLMSNSTIGGFSQFQKDSAPHQYLRVLGENLFTSLVPYGWRHGYTGFFNTPPVLQFDPRFGKRYTPLPQDFNRQTEWFSDLVNNQDSLLGNLGWTGMICLVLALLMAASVGLSTRTGSSLGAKWKIWLICFVIGIPLSIGMATDYSPHGLAHINLQPFVIFLLIFIVRHLRKLPLSASGLLLCLFLMEASFSTAALIALEQRSVPLIRSVDGKLLITGINGNNVEYVSNYADKIQMHLVFLSDRLHDLWKPFFLSASVLSLGLWGAAMAWSCETHTRRDN